MFDVMLGFEVGWHWISFCLLFSPAWGNLMSFCVCTCSVPVRCWYDVTTVMIDSPFSPCHSCLSSCQTKRQLNVDLLYIGFSFLTHSFWKLEDLLSESLFFGFQDEDYHFTFLWLMVFFLCVGSSFCYFCCLRMQIIVNVDVKKLFEGDQSLVNLNWNAIILEQRNYVGMSEVMRWRFHLFSPLRLSS